MSNHKNYTRYLLGAMALVMILTTAGCSVLGGIRGANGTPSAGVESGEVGSLTITENVEASGTVNPVQDAQLTWKTSGIVESVNAKAGDQVKAGDVLASLALTSLPANVLSAQADLINAQQALDDLTPSALAITQAEQKVAAAEDDVRKKQDIVDGLGTPANDADIEQAKATVLLNKIQLDKAWDRYKPYQNRPENNPVRAMLYNRWAQAKQAYDTSVRRLNNLTGTSVNPTDLALAQANLDLAKAALIDAEQNLGDLKAGANSNDVAAAKARITSAEATLSAISLNAPFDGEILVVDVQPGDVVNTGQSAFRLANRAQAHVDTLIDESDVHNIQVGDRAEITMDVMPGKNLTGTVAFINPEGETVSGNVKYSVRIDLDPIDQPLLLGATADVTIQTGEPSPALTVPVRAIQTDSQGEYVNLVQPDGTLKRIDIVSGQLKGDQVIILSGNLKIGDKVELSAATNEMLNRMQDMQNLQQGNQ
jgi:RND family efflux transporter MFP subunit